MLRHVKNGAPQGKTLISQVYEYVASNKNESRQCKISALWRKYGVLSLGSMKSYNC